MSANSERLRNANIELSGWWQPWWLRYASYEGVILRISDSECMKSYIEGVHSNSDKKYDIGLGATPCSKLDICPTAQTPHVISVWSTDDEHEANLAFEKINARIVELSKLTDFTQRIQRAALIVIESVSVESSP